jgi:hypothetical protein
MQNSYVQDAVDFGVRSEDAPRRHALVPVLLGLLAPVVVLSIIDVRALASATVIVHIYLFALFVIAAGAYFVSIIEPGEITRVTVDRKARMVSLERTGLLARSTLDIPFADIAAVRIESHGDDDGYETAVPVMVLTTREVLPLPAGTSEADVATMRSMLKGSSAQA